MLKVFYASALEALVDALVEGIFAERAEHREGALVPVTVIVPHKAIASYLKMAIAQKTGIAANLRFVFLERFLAGAVPALEGLEVTDSAHLRALIAGVLLDPARMREPELEVVREYVEAGGDDRPAIDRRTYELADQLARLFREYRHTRRAMLEAWPKRATMSDSVRAETERWQRALHNRLPKHALLPDAIERAPLDRLALPAHVHLFGFGLLSPAHVEMLLRIGERIPVRLHLLNPCRAFWQERGEEGTPLLSLWGRPGREHVALLNEATGYTFEERFQESLPEKNALDVLRNDVLDARSGLEKSPSNEGIVLWACPGPRRELEAIAAEIWSLLRREGSTLAMHEIAVAIAGSRDADAYRLHVASVFAEAYEIPHHYLDVPIRSSSRIVEAIELLLALPLSRFSRQDLLRLLIHPAITAGDEELDTAEWSRWLDTLAVVHGRDRGDHRDTYIEKDLYNWDQGMRRLVLGVFMSGERSGDERPYEHEGQLYLPLECAPDRTASVGKLLVLVRSLIADARAIAEATWTLGAWMDRLHRYLTTYVKADADADARDLESCLGAIRELASADAGGRKVSFTIAASFVRSAISGLEVNRGQALAEGVSIAPLQTIAALPFKVVFVVGLGEGKFPASQQRSQLDLRNETRKRGDVSPRDEDEYAFLQRVLATRDRLYLSWVSRDSRTGDELQPSSIVLELQSVFEARFGALPIVKHPLRRFDPSCFEDQAALPSMPARREHAISALRADLVQAIGGDAFPDLPQLQRELPRELYEPLSQRLGLCPVPSSAEPERARHETLEVPLWIVRQFLENPKEAWTKLVLRLRDERNDDPLARVDEAFAASSIDASNLLRDIYFARLDRTGDVLDEERFFRAQYRDRAVLLELRGMLPTGVFAVAEREKHVATLLEWSRLIRAAHFGPMQATEPLRFGRARESTRVSELLDPIALALQHPRPIRVELSGQTSPELPPRTSLMLLLGAEPGRNHFKKAFVEHAAAAALGFDGVDRRVLVVSGNGKKKSARFLPFTREEARAWFVVLLEDLLGRPHLEETPDPRLLEPYDAKVEEEA